MSCKILCRVGQASSDFYICPVFIPEMVAPSVSNGDNPFRHTEFEEEKLVNHSKLQSHILALCMVFFVCLVAPAICHPQIPQTINFQGYLTDDNGQPTRARHITFSEWKPILKNWKWAGTIAIKISMGFSVPMSGT